jgi:hypothetical protein
MNMAGRALALDPESTRAAALVTQLMLEPPAQLPVDLERTVGEIGQTVAKKSTHGAKFALLTFFAFLPLLIWDGITDWTIFSTIFGYFVVLIVYAHFDANAKRPRSDIGLILTAILPIMVTRMIGPLVLVPALIGTIVMALSGQPRLIDRRWFVTSVALTAFLIPIGLEALGVFARTWEITNDSLVIHSGALRLAGPISYILLITTSAAMVVISALLGQTIATSRRDAERKLEIQAWHLRQLLPRSATESAS